MERELTLEVVRVTEWAAMAAARWMGRGDNVAADRAAVDAMRAMLDTVDMAGTVVIGEGERDEAPMLYRGEKVGSGRGRAVDVAVDPIDGTDLVARGLPNALSILAVAPRGGLLRAPDVYMEKLAAGPAAAGRVHLDRPVEDNLAAVADALGKPVGEVTVAVLERPRHADLVSRLRKAGARIRLISDGDVAAAVATAQAGTGIDLLVGTGGAPEGVLAAVALACLGGDFQARLRPADEAQRTRVTEAGLAHDGRLLAIADLVPGDDAIFAATGITGGDWLRGVRFSGEGTYTHSVVMRRRTGTVRYVEALHHPERKRPQGS